MANTLGEFKRRNAYSKSAASSSGWRSQKPHELDQLTAQLELLRFELMNFDRGSSLLAEMMCRPYPPDFCAPRFVRERLDNVRAFSRDSIRNLVLSQLYTGTLLVRTARRLDIHSDAYFKCLKSARNCEESIERNLWRLREETDVFNRLASDLERLHHEIIALIELET
jgi:hypothetical protein